MAQSRKFPLTLLTLAFIGFIDATYLTAEHFLGQIPPCSIAGSNCASVLTSPYASVWGVPIALVGAGYYLVLVLLLAVYYKKEERQPLFFAAILSGLGALVSAGLIFIQLFVIHAVCLYCMVSAAISVSLAILSAVLLSERFSNKNNPSYPN